MYVAAYTCMRSCERKRVHVIISYILRVCTYGYIRACMGICVRITGVYAYACMTACMNTRVRIFSACCVRVRARMYVCVCARTHVCMRVWGIRVYKQSACAWRLCRGVTKLVTG